MSNIESMFKAVEFIEKHLKEEIAVVDIAEAVFYSLYHFCRMFNKAIHHTPYDYLMRRRLSESARELIESDRKIIDIAFDYQFNSHETYSRAFKRMFGMQPNQWRKQGKINQRLLMPVLTFEHIMHINKGEYLKPVLEEKSAFQVAGLMTLVKDDQTVISTLWEMFAQELEGIENKIQPEQYYGISYYPKNWENRGIFYMAAVVINSPDKMSSALITKAIPPLKYARFIHKGLIKDLNLTLDYVYQTWLPKSGKSLSYPLQIEYYGQDCRGSDNEESERAIYIPIKETH